MPRGASTFLERLLAKTLGQQTILLKVDSREIEGVASENPQEVVRRPCSALGHPRTLMGSFGEISECLTSILGELSRGRLVRARPRVVIQLPRDPKGGYTDMERRAFCEAALAAGALDVRVVTSPIPLDERAIRELFSERRP